MDYEKLFAEKMDRLLMDEMVLTNTPGLAVGIIEDGNLDMTRNYGARDFEKNLVIEQETLFCVASVTKSFICAAVLKLQEQGKLQVNDPIAKYLPITIGFYHNPITIHHLMTHSSGIPDLSDLMWYRNRENTVGIQRALPKYPFSSWDDGFRYINGAQDYLAEPGKRFHYNNLGYGILSRLITVVAEEDFRSFIKREIFTPLDMTQSGFWADIDENNHNLSVPYFDEPGEKTKKLVRTNYDDIRLTRSLDEAAGGLFSSITDLAKYMKMHLNKGTSNGTQILSTASCEMMQSIQFKEEYPNTAFQEMYNQNVSGYGYGFAIDEDFFGTKLVQHSGSFIGASAWFAFLPAFNRGVVILSNHHPSPRMFAQAILMETLGYDCEEEWRLLKLRKFQEELCGTYSSYKEISLVEVIKQGTELVVQNKQFGMKMVLYPQGDDLMTFNYYLPTDAGGRMTVQFVKEHDHLFLYMERNKWRKQ